MSESLRIHIEAPGDRHHTRRVLLDAFGQPHEAKLVDDLRAAGDIALALVAELDDIVGFVAFSRLILDNANAKALALAPLAVSPKQQRQGVGRTLVRDGIARAGAAGQDALLVVGDPAYYGRFGFGPAPPGLTTPYDGSNLQVLALSPRGARLSGAVRYPAAFAGLA
jgi:putative acetyltransferase